MKSYRWLIIAVLLLTGWFFTEYLLHRRVVPPENVKSLQAFLAWQPSAKYFGIAEATGSQHLVAFGRKGGILPSGPSGYVFDSSGHLVDWSADVGDNPDFAERWQLQRSWEGRTLSRQEAANWPATRPAQ